MSVSSSGFRVPERKTENRKRSYGSMKGQYFSFDAIVASAIFILTFIALVSYWFSVKSGLEAKDDEISKEAARITDSMFTPSFLTNSYGDRRVRVETLNSVLGVGESRLMGQFNSPYSIYINVTQAPESDHPLQVGSFGTLPPQKTKNVARVRRVFVLTTDRDGMNESQAVMDLFLYE